MMLTRLYFKALKNGPENKNCKNSRTSLKLELTMHFCRLCPHAKYPILKLPPACVIATTKA